MANENNRLLWIYWSNKEFWIDTIKWSKRSKGCCDRIALFIFFIIEHAHTLVYNSSFMLAGQFSLGTYLGMNSLTRATNSDFSKQFLHTSPHFVRIDLSSFTLILLKLIAAKSYGFGYLSSQIWLSFLPSFAQILSTGLWKPSGLTTSYFWE